MGSSFTSRQYGELIAATDDIECPDSDGFQLAFLRSSISTLACKIVLPASLVKQPLLSLTTFRSGNFNQSHCFEAMKAILEQSEEGKGDFHASKTIVSVLDASKDSINGTTCIMLVTRTSELNGKGGF